MSIALSKAKQAAIETRFHEPKRKCQQLHSEKDKRLAKSREIRRFAKALTSDENTGWGEEEWLMLLDRVTFQHDRTIDFLFKDGTGIKSGAK